MISVGYVISGAIQFDSRTEIEALIPKRGPLGALGFQPKRIYRPARFLVVTHRTLASGTTHMLSSDLNFFW
jgi:hypothetical protein